LATAKVEAAVTPADLAPEMSILPAIRTATALANPSSCDAAKAIPLDSAMVKLFSSWESAREFPLPLLEFVSFSEKKSATALAIPLP